MNRALLTLLLAAPLARAQDDQPFRDRPSLHLASEAARWLASVEVETEHGLAWPVDAAQPDSVAVDLYAGNAGVVLFHAELSRASGAEAFGAVARRGADELLHRIDGLYEARGGGLYTGTAGVAFALEVVHGATGDGRYRAGANRLLDELLARAEEVEGGVRWNGSSDVISGSAGIGLYLLWASERMERPDALAMALRAAGHLLGRAQGEGPMLSWPMSEDHPRRMPNFSHGTAGVAYFLVRLHGAAPDPDLLDAASRGARHLLSIADTQRGTLRIHHHTPGGEDLYYYGWCHGPVGTARLFHQLGRLQEGVAWGAWVDRLVRAIFATPLPAQRVEGLWDNVGQCCGTAGVAQFLADQFRITPEVELRLFAERFQADVITRAEKGEEGWSWPQAEHRTKPDLIQSQTGYMQGAAGIGMMLLHFDALQQERLDVTRLPDDPFGV